MNNTSYTRDLLDKTKSFLTENINKPILKESTDFVLKKTVNIQDMLKFAKEQAWEIRKVPVTLEDDTKTFVYELSSGTNICEVWVKKDNTIDICTLRGPDPDGLTEMENAISKRFGGTEEPLY